MNFRKNNTDKMKKNYIQPEITASLRYEVEKPLCGSITRSAQWGNFETTDYSNGNWFNEGHPDRSTSTSVVGIADDAGTIDSQSKGRGSDWGTIW